MDILGRGNPFGRAGVTALLVLAALPTVLLAAVPPAAAATRDCDAGPAAARAALADWPHSQAAGSRRHCQAVMDHSPPEVIVPVDSFQIARQDQLLCARLRGSFALCISDEVHEAGALIHVQAGRPGRTGNNPDLTDNTLSTDLLLLDRCLTELQLAEPRARHWQARFVAHADPEAGGVERLAALQAFIEVYLEDAGVHLSSAVTHEGAGRSVVFRPALRTLRCEPAEGDTQVMRLSS